MTSDEAIGYIKGKLDCMKKCDTFDCLNSDDCDECYFCYAQGTFGEQKEAFEIAIQALEKQSGYSKEDIELNQNAMYNKAIDDFVKFANTMPTVEEEDGSIRPMGLEEIAEQLKEHDVK